MAKNQAVYDNESIKQLKDEDRVRLRPSVIFGSDGIEGCQHAVFEIISNSIDEHREGYGDKIEVKLYADNSVSVRDYGRGCPVDYNAAEKRYNWELVFCELYAGGKYDNNAGGSFKFSLGLNGLGLCSTQYASEYMETEIVRDGTFYELSFRKGRNIGGLKKTPTANRVTGTYHKWKPDSEVFTDINLDIEYFKDILKRQAIVNAGLCFELYDEKSGEQFEFKYENGIKDYVNELGGGTAFTEPVYWQGEGKGRDRADKDDYELKFELAFCFTNENPKLEYYHNSSWLEYGGTPDKAVRLAFVSAVDNYLKNAGVYKKDEKKLTFNDIEDSLLLISSSFSTFTSFENQTKKSINNRFIQECMTDFLKKKLEVYFIENKADADAIAQQAIINKRSRETAEKTRLSIKKKLTGSIDINNRVEKFVNCRSKDLLQREIYIVEGDSALGACKLGRDAEYQAIMPVRGKILNCMTADYDRIFQSEIITNLVRVLGCGVEVKSKHNRDLNSFDLEKLNWNKVIICTDADFDGFHIRTLILSMIYKLMPTLIREHKVFIAESPLYEITSAKKIYFAYNDAERDKITAKLSGKYTIQRSKGLGENEPDMMWETTMNPETRKLVSVQPADIDKTLNMFDMLLGDNIKARKDFIEEFGYKYIDTAEAL